MLGKPMCLILNAFKTTERDSRSFSYTYITHSSVNFLYCYLLLYELPQQLSSIYNVNLKVHSALVFYSYLSDNNRCNKIPMSNKQQNKQAHTMPCQYWNTWRNTTWSLPWSSIHQWNCYKLRDFKLVCLWSISIDFLFHTEHTDNFDCSKRHLPIVN
jgi:hypothetical protein